jgi:hypothetical protein
MGVGVAEHGQTSATVTVLVGSDVAFEPDETFTVRLSDPVNATLGRATAAGTIVDDEPFVVSADGADVVEGNAGTTSATFTVTLDHPVLVENVGWCC